jgi:hypothetical protein
MTSATFCLFEVILKKGRPFSFKARRDGLVRAAEWYVCSTGNEVWFCSTVQPDAFRHQLETNTDVEYFREIP